MPIRFQAKSGLWGNHRTLFSTPIEPQVNGKCYQCCSYKQNKYAVIKIWTAALRNRLHFYNYRAQYPLHFYLHVEERQNLNFIYSLIWQLWAYLLDFFCLCLSNQLNANLDFAFLDLETSHWTFFFALYRVTHIVEIIKLLWKFFSAQRNKRTRSSIKTLAVNLCALIKVRNIPNGFLQVSLPWKYSR